MNINPYGSSPLTEQDLANMQRISNGRLSVGENIHQTQNLLSSLLVNQSQYPTRYGSPAASQSPVYEKRSPPPFWSPTKPKNDNNNNNLVENRNLGRNVNSKLIDTFLLFHIFIYFYFRWITQRSHIHLEWTTP